MSKRRLLIQLFQVGKTIENRASALKEAHVSYKQELREFRAIIGWNHHKKKKLREQFRHTTMTSKEYQELLQPLQKQNKKARRGIHKLFDKHFAPHFENIVGGHTRSDVIEKVADL